MSLVITTELQGNGVYLAGEPISCVIQLRNESEKSRTIAWIGAQLHSQCTYRQDLRVAGASVTARSPATDTTFIPNKDEPGVTLTSTPTLVVVCNLTLQPRESKAVRYSETIPAGGPPSFNGRFLQYKYKLTVGAQEPGSPTHFVRIPFHVLTVPENLVCNPVSWPAPVDNPFLNTQEQQQHGLEMELHMLTTEASRRALMNYTLKSNHGAVGRLSLFKSSYKLGEDIIGSFDFSCNSVTCLQLVVALQCLEEVNAELVSSPSNLKPVCTTHAHYLECCHNAMQTHFALPIPQTVSQSFQSAEVRVHWQLRFEFMITKGPPDGLIKATIIPCLGGSKATLCQGLQPVDVESMTWNLPLVILPTLPLQQSMKQHTLIL